MTEGRTERAVGTACSYLVQPQKPMPPRTTMTYRPKTRNTPTVLPTPGRFPGSADGRRCRGQMVRLLALGRGRGFHLREFKRLHGCCRNRFARRERFDRRCTLWAFGYGWSRRLARFGFRKFRCRRQRFRLGRRRGERLRLCNVRQRRCFQRALRRRGRFLFHHGFGSGWPGRLCRRSETSPEESVTDGMARKTATQFGHLIFLPAASSCTFSLR